MQLEERARRLEKTLQEAEEAEKKGHPRTVVREVVLVKGHPILFWSDLICMAKLKKLMFGGMGFVLACTYIGKDSQEDSCSKEGSDSVPHKFILLSR